MSVTEVGATDDESSSFSCALFVCASKESVGRQFRPGAFSRISLRNRNSVEQHALSYLSGMGLPGDHRPNVSLSLSPRDIRAVARNWVAKTAMSEFPR